MLTRASASAVGGRVDGSINELKESPQHLLKNSPSENVTYLSISRAPEIATLPHGRHAVSFRFFFFFGLVFILVFSFFFRSDELNSLLLHFTLRVFRCCGSTWGEPCHLRHIPPHRPPPSTPLVSPHSKEGFVVWRDNSLLYPLGLEQQGPFWSSLLLQHRVSEFHDSHCMVKG